MPHNPLTCAPIPPNPASSRFSKIRCHGTAANGSGTTPGRKIPAASGAARLTAPPMATRATTRLPSRAVSCSCSVREPRPPPAAGRTPRPHHRRCVQSRGGTGAARVSRHPRPAAAVGAAETDVLAHHPPRRPRRRRHVAHHPARCSPPAARPPAAGHPAAPPAETHRLAVPAGAGGLRLCLAIAASAERAGHGRAARRGAGHRPAAAPVLPHARRRPAKTAAPLTLPPPPATKLSAILAPLAACGAAPSCRASHPACVRRAPALRPRAARGGRRAVGRGRGGSFGRATPSMRQSGRSSRSMPGAASSSATMSGSLSKCCNCEA